MVSQKKKSLQEGLQDFSFGDCNSCLYWLIDWVCLDVCVEEEMRQAVISKDRIVAHFFVTEYIMIDQDVKWNLI